MLVCIRDIDKNVVRQPNRRIPIGIHGDDAGTAGRHCVLGINWGSVAQSLATMDSRIAFTGIRTEDCVQDDTVIEIYKVLKWSLNVLAEGKWPSLDHNGVPFTTTWRTKKARTLLAGGFVGAYTRWFWPGAATCFTAATTTCRL